MNSQQPTSPLSPTTFTAEDAHHPPSPTRYEEPSHSPSRRNKLSRQREEETENVTSPRQKTVDVSHPPTTPASAAVSALTSLLPLATKAFGRQPTEEEEKEGATLAQLTEEFRSSSRSPSDSYSSLSSAAIVPGSSALIPSPSSSSSNRYRFPLHSPFDAEVEEDEEEDEEEEDEEAARKRRAKKKVSAAAAAASAALVSAVYRPSSSPLYRNLPPAPNMSAPMECESKLTPHFNNHSLAWPTLSGAQVAMTGVNRYLIHFPNESAHGAQAGLYQPGKPSLLIIHATQETLEEEKEREKKAQEVETIVKVEKRIKSKKSRSGDKSNSKRSHRRHNSNEEEVSDEQRSSSSEDEEEKLSTLLASSHPVPSPLHHRLIRIPCKVAVKPTVKRSCRVRPLYEFSLHPLLYDAYTHDLATAEEQWSTSQRVKAPRYLLLRQDALNPIHIIHITQWRKGERVTPDGTTTSEGEGFGYSPLHILPATEESIHHVQTRGRGKDDARRLETSQLYISFRIDGWYEIRSYGSWRVVAVEMSHHKGGMQISTVPIPFNNLPDHVSISEALQAIALLNGSKGGGGTMSVNLMANGRNVTYQQQQKAKQQQAKQQHLLQQQQQQLKQQAKHASPALTQAVQGTNVSSQVLSTTQQQQLLEQQFQRQFQLQMFQQQQQLVVAQQQQQAQSQQPQSSQQQSSHQSAQTQPTLYPGGPPTSIQLHANLPPIPMLPPLLMIKKGTPAPVNTNLSQTNSHLALPSVLSSTNALSFFPGLTPTTPTLSNLTLPSPSPPPMSAAVAAAAAAASAAPLSVSQHSAFTSTQPKKRDRDSPNPPDEEETNKLPKVEIEGNNGNSNLINSSASSINDRANPKIVNRLNSSDGIKQENHPPTSPFLPPLPLSMSVAIPMMGEGILPVQAQVASYQSFNPSFISSPTNAIGAGNISAHSLFTDGNIASSITLPSPMSIQALPSFPTSFDARHTPNTNTNRTNQQEQSSSLSSHSPQEQYLSPSNAQQQQNLQQNIPNQLQQQFQQQLHRQQLQTQLQQQQQQQQQQHDHQQQQQQQQQRHQHQRTHSQPHDHLTVPSSSHTHSAHHATFSHSPTQSSHSNQQETMQSKKPQEGHKSLPQPIYIPHSPSRGQENKNQTPPPSNVATAAASTSSGTASSSSSPPLTLFSPVPANLFPSSLYGISVFTPSLPSQLPLSNLPSVGESNAQTAATGTPPSFASTQPQYPTYPTSLMSPPSNNDGEVTQLSEPEGLYPLQSISSTTSDQGGNR